MVDRDVHFGRFCVPLVVFLKRGFLFREAFIAAVEIADLAPVGTCSDLAPAPVVADRLLIKMLFSLILTIT